MKPFLQGTPGGMAGFARLARAARAVRGTLVPSGGRVPGRQGGLPWVFRFRPGAALGLVFCVSAFLIALPLAAASPFEEGNALFQEGKFSEAETAYNRSLAQEGDSAATRFNLGRVREALGDSPGAMVEWERALRLKPGYPAAEESLQTARTTLGSKVDPLPWLVRWRPVGALGRERWILAAGFWGAGVCALVWGFNRRRHGAVAGVVLGLSVGALGWVWARHADGEKSVALVIERSGSLRAAPADPARLLDTLPGGSRLRVLDASGGWNRVEAPGGEVGWIASKSIERL